MDSLWVLFLGAFAAFLGFVNLENARKGLFLRPLTIFWSAVAGYFYIQNFSGLPTLGGDSALVAYSLVFCAVSPLLGWFWWGREGRIRLRFLQLLGFVFLAGAAFLAWSHYLRLGWESVGLAVMTAAFPFLPIRKKLRSFFWSWRSWRRGHAERREARRLESRERRQVKDERVPDLLQTELARKLEAKDRQIASLESKEAQRQGALQRRREETIAQIHLLREQAVQRIQQHGGGLRFHAHYGFLMAEAWRVLRAQLARGERIPAAEHDVFFHQVVADLVKAEDFEERYLHRRGRKAISSVNRYLDGLESLDTIRSSMRRLKLRPALLAPEPLGTYTGQELLEAWLVPHRRYQDRLWEDFQDGRHPRQEQVVQFLRERGQGLPTQGEWRLLWDQNPEVFGNSRERGASSPVERGKQLWRVVSSIWLRVKAR